MESNLVNFITISVSLVAVVSAILIFISGNNYDNGKWKKIVIKKTYSWQLLILLIFLSFLLLLDLNFIVNILFFSIAIVFIFWYIWKIFSLVVGLNQKYLDLKTDYILSLNEVVKKEKEKRERKIQENREIIFNFLKSKKTFFVAKDYFFNDGGYEKITDFNFKYNHILEISKKELEENFGYKVLKYRLLDYLQAKYENDENIELEKNDLLFGDDEKSKIIFNKEDLNFYVSNKIYEDNKSFFKEIKCFFDNFIIYKKTIEESKKEKDSKNEIDELLDSRNTDDINILFNEIRLYWKVKELDLYYFSNLLKYFLDSNKKNKLYERDVVYFVYTNLEESVKENDINKFKSFINFYIYGFYNLSKIFNSELFKDRSWRRVKELLEHQWNFFDNNNAFNEQKYKEFNLIALKEYSNLLKKLIDQDSLDDFKFYLDNLFNKMKDVFHYDRVEENNFLNNNRMEIIFGLGSYIYEKDKEKQREKDEKQENEFLKIILNILTSKLNSVQEYFELLDRVIEIEWSKESKWDWSWWRSENYIDRGAWSETVGETHLNFFVEKLLSDKNDNWFNLELLDDELILSKNLSLFFDKEYLDNQVINDFVQKWREKKEKKFKELVIESELDKNKISEIKNEEKENWDKEKKKLKQIFDISFVNKINNKSRFGKIFFDLRERYIIKKEFNSHIGYMRNIWSDFYKDIFRNIIKEKISNKVEEVDNIFEKLNNLKTDNYIIVVDYNLMTDFLYGGKWQLLSVFDKVWNTENELFETYFIGKSKNRKIPVYSMSNIGSKVYLLNKDKLGKINFYNPALNDSEKKDLVSDDLLVSILEKKDIDVDKIKIQDKKTKEEKEVFLKDKVLVKVFVKWEYINKNKVIGWYAKSIK